MQGNSLKNEFYSSKNSDQTLIGAEDLTGLKAGISASLGDMIKYIGNTLQELGSWRNQDISDDALLVKITSWKILFDSFAAKLHLDLISQDLDKLFSYSVSFVIQLS